MNRLFLSSVFLISLIGFSEGFEISLKSHDDLLGFPILWKFPKDRPYTYFENTTVIPTPFLPIKRSAIPFASGIWILRYKDFSGPARTFTQNKDTSIAIIEVHGMARMLESIKVKVLLYGDVSLDVVAPRDQNVERVHLANYRDKCENSRSAGKAKESLAWVVYEITDVGSTGSVRFQLEAKIHHPKSFLMIDEISFLYSGMDNNNNELEQSSRDGRQFVDGSRGQYRLRCSEHS